MNSTRLFFSSSVSFVPKNDIEELDGIIQRQQTIVVQIRWGILDATQWEGFDGTIGASEPTTGIFFLKETLRFQIMHKVVGVIRRCVAACALAFAKEDILATQFHPKYCSPNCIGDNPSFIRKIGDPDFVRLDNIKFSI